MQDLIKGVRETRNRYSIDKPTALDLSVRCGASVDDDFRQLEPFIKLLAGVGTLTVGADVTKPAQSATHVHADFEAFVSLAGLIDVTAEIARLEKQKGEKEKALQGVRSELENKGFVEKAKPETVQAERERMADLENQLRLIEENLQGLRQG
jgi:valyl-tRNA synthetase